MKKALSEADLARGVVEWLQADGWDVWTEVMRERGGPVCDIVAKRGHVVHAIECKTAAGLSVLEQASYWNEAAHFTSAAVPRSSQIFERVALMLGVGVLVTRDGGVRQRSGPMNRVLEHRFARPLSHYLTEEVKAWGAEPGNANGDRYTPFRMFCRDVLATVSAHPGITLKDCIAALEKHHYSSNAAARSSLRQWVGRRKVPGVRFGDPDGRALRLYPDSAEVC